MADNVWKDSEEQASSLLKTNVVGTGDLRHSWSGDGNWKVYTVQISGVGLEILIGFQLQHHWWTTCLLLFCKNEFFVLLWENYCCLTREKCQFIGQLLEWEGGAMKITDMFLSPSPSIHSRCSVGILNLGVLIEIVLFLFSWKELMKGVCGVSTCGHLIGDITFCTIISKGSQGNSRGFKIVLIKRKHKTTIFLLQIYEKINFQMQLRVRSSKSWSAKQLLKCSCLLSPRETFLLPYVWFGAPLRSPLANRASAQV